MTHLGFFLVLTDAGALMLASLGLSAAGQWYNEEGRRLRRGLRKVLRGGLDPLVIADDHGRGAGFNLADKTMAVAWDAGEWCLVYRIQELLGVELIVDEWVTGWAFGNEGLWSAEAPDSVKRQVSLRLVLADPQHDEFVLELWNAERAGDPTVRDVRDAVQEGNRWLARIEAILHDRPLSTAAVPVKPPRREIPSFRQLELVEG